MRNLTLEGKITFFKALVMSKIVHLALITNTLTSTMKELNKIQKIHLEQQKSKHKTYYCMYQL